MIIFLFYFIYGIYSPIACIHTGKYRQAKVWSDIIIHKSQDVSDRNLEIFFRNLLLGENNELRNRYMVVNPQKN